MCKKVLACLLFGVLLGGGSGCQTMCLLIYPFAGCNSGLPSGDDNGGEPSSTTPWLLINNQAVLNGGELTIGPGGNLHLDLTGRPNGPFIVKINAVITCSAAWVCDWTAPTGGTLTIEIIDVNGRITTWVIVVWVIPDSPPPSPIADLMIVATAPANGSSYYTGETITTTVQITGGISPFRVRVFWADFSDPEFVSSKRSISTSHLLQVPVSPEDDDGFGVLTWRVIDANGTVKTVEILYEVRNH